jgi:O-antigen/teichoic acid export membrane protein
MYKKINTIKNALQLKISNVYKRLKKYLHNTFWIMGDKIINLGVAFVITIVIARYLGPENFGIYSYAISVASLFAAAGHMGLSGLVVRETIKKPAERGVILGTTLGIKFIGVAVGFVSLVIYAVVFEGPTSMQFAILVVAGMALLFSPFDVIDFWFQALLQARYVTIARLSGLLVSSTLKLLFVFLGFSVVYLVGANIANGITVAIILVIIYKLKANIKISDWSFSWNKAKELLKQGSIIYLGSIFAVIYLKVDQVMLRWFEGAEAVGIYAVAAQLSEAWYFIPVAIVASAFPRLIKLKEESTDLFNIRLQQLFDLLFIIALVVAIVMTLLSERIITFFYGDFYIESAAVLVIHTWAALFIFLRAALSKWILIENVLVFSLITQGSGALINIALNYVLIPSYGVQGAAYATLISYSFASFFSLLLFSKTRPVFLMMFKSFFCIFRYLIRVKFFNSSQSK